jgi:hypothetical protein
MPTLPRRATIFSAVAGFIGALMAYAVAETGQDEGGADPDASRMTPSPLSGLLDHPNYYVAAWLGLAGCVIVTRRPRIGAALLLVAGLLLLGTTTASSSDTDAATVVGRAALIIASLPAWLVADSSGVRWGRPSVKWWVSLAIAAAPWLTLIALVVVSSQMGGVVIGALSIEALYDPRPFIQSMFWILINAAPILWFAVYAVLSIGDAVRHRAFRRPVAAG